MSEYSNLTYTLLNQNSLKRSNCGFLNKGQRRNQNTSHLIQPKLVCRCIVIIYYFIDIELYLFDIYL